MPRTLNALDNRVRLPKLSNKFGFARDGTSQGSIGLKKLKPPVNIFKNAIKSPMYNRNQNLKTFRIKKISVNDFGQRQTRKTAKPFT